MSWMTRYKAWTKLPDLLFRNRFSFSFDGVPLASDRLSHSQKANLVKAGIDMMLRNERTYALPAAIQIEPCNICNLQCPLCPTGTNQGHRPKGVMSLETFRTILDELGDSLILAVLYGWGEPFLNKDLPRMIRHCTDRNIRTVTSTNGHFLQTLDEALEVVDAGLSVLIIAIDGSTQEIYDRYRKGGSVKKVKRCVAFIEEAKAKRGSALPYTNLRVVVTRNNCDDLHRLEQFARTAGTNMFSCKSVGCLSESDSYGDFEPPADNLRRFDYRGSARRRKPAVQCPYPFRQPTVFWDGTLAGCEFDYNLELPYGKLDLRHSWNSPAAMKMRRAIRGRLPRPGFCDACPYQDRVQESCILVKLELPRPDIPPNKRQIG
jgi:MoaA/NifB/PqqE/SkfB family radical SAM enzyme